MEPDDLQIDPGFEALRALPGGAVGVDESVEQALAAPATGRNSAWEERVNVALVELEADFGEHVELTEGPERSLPGPPGDGAATLQPGDQTYGWHSQIRKWIDRLLAGLGRPVTTGDVDGIRSPPPRSRHAQPAPPEGRRPRLRRLPDRHRRRDLNHVLTPTRLRPRLRARLSRPCRVLADEWRVGDQGVDADEARRP